MILSDVIATLVNEPYNRSTHEIGRLTLFQVKRLFFCAKDEKGRVELTEDPDAVVPDPIARHFVWASVNRVPMWRAREILRERQSKELYGGR